MSGKRKKLLNLELSRSRGWAANKRLDNFEVGGKTGRSLLRQGPVGGWSCSEPETRPGVPIGVGTY